VAIGYRVAVGCRPFASPGSAGPAAAAAPHPSPATVAQCDQAMSPGEASGPGPLMLASSAEHPKAQGNSSWRNAEGLQHAWVPPIDGIEELWMSFAAWTVMWTLLFYLLSYTWPQWGSRIQQSTKAHENGRYWSARNVIGVIHAVFIAALTVPSYIALSGGGDYIRFGYTGHLATCAVGPDHPLPPALIQPWEFMVQAVALAGLAFTSFTCADICICLLHGLSSADYIVHHIAFISAGLLIRGHCMLPFNAAILMAMEASTPFLNFVLFFRHRGPRYGVAVQVSGIIFVILFIVVRLGLNTYGAVILWLHRDTAMPPTVPKWQAWLLIAAVVAGAGVQFFWFPQIVKTFGSGLRDLLGSRRRSTDAAGDAISSSGDCSEGRSPGCLSSTSQEEEPRTKQSEGATEQAPAAPTTSADLLAN